MKKVLIIGGSHRDIPLIKACKELGFFTITLGNLDYYIGYKYSDKNYKNDFTNFEIIEEIILKEQIDFLIPGSGELPMYIVSKISNGKYFDSLDVFKKLHYKNEFKKICESLSIHTPLQINKKDLNRENLKFPLIVKAINLSGGKGVFKVTNKNELFIAIEEIKKLTNSEEYVVEEFLESNLFAYSVILKNQRIIYGFFAKEIENENFYVTKTYKIKYLNKKIIDKDIEKLASNLDLKDGLLHVQFMEKKGIPFIIEVTRRIPGDLFPNLIEYCDGISYSKVVIKSYINDTDDIENLLIKNKDEYFLRYCLQTKKDILYDTIVISEKLIVKEIVEIYDKKTKIKANSLVAIVIFKFEKNILEKIDKYIKIREIKE